MLKLTNTTIVIIAAIVVIAAVVFLKKKTQIQEDWSTKRCLKFKKNRLNPVNRDRNTYKNGCSANLPPSIKKKNCDRASLLTKVAERRKSTYDKQCR